MELPLVGHAYLLVDYNRLYHALLDTARQFQCRSYYWHLPFMPVWHITSSPQVLEHIHKQAFAKYKKADYLADILSKLLGHGIFAVDDDEWKVQRKIASNIFTVRNFRDFFINVFWDGIGQVLEVLREHSSNGKQVDLHQVFHMYTLESFAKIGFGLDLRLFQDASEESMAFARAFDKAQNITDKRFFNPLWKVTEKLTGADRDFKECQRVMKAFSKKVIDERRENGIGHGEEDLLSRFMERGIYNGDQLHDIVINMIIAGRDTTAQALSWTIYQLNENPECITKIRQEIDSILREQQETYQSDENGQLSHHEHSRLSFSYQDILKMKYTKAVVSETLRLHPSVPKQAKVAVENDVWPDGTIIRKGEWAVWSSWVNGRLSEIWGDDALSFRPERFLETNEKGETVEINHSQYKFPVFNMGPRLCLGMNMAYLEATIALALLVDLFDFELVDPQSVKYQNALTLPMLNGLKVRVKERMTNHE